MLATMLAYVGLFVISFLAATLLPLGSELPLAVLVRAEGRLVLPVAVATAGNVAGSLTTYWLARRAATTLGARPWSARGEGRAAELWRRHGAPSLLLSWVPLFGDGLVAAAGAAGLPLRTVTPWLIVGKVGRYLVVAWLALAA